MEQINWGAVGVIVSLISLAIMIYTVIKSNAKGEEKMQGQIDLVRNDLQHTNGKIDTLSTRVDKHNGFAEKIPIIEEKINVANHRINDLEDGQDKITEKLINITRR